MHQAAARVERQAENMGLFDDFKPYDETMLDSDFRSRFESKLRDDIRGFGYWCWKPQVALQALAQMQDGDVLIYVDAGCHLNPPSVLSLTLPTCFREFRRVCRGRVVLG